MLNPVGAALFRHQGRDAGERGQARVWLAFVAQAAVSPVLGEAVRDSYAGIAALFVRLVRAEAESTLRAAISGF
ncbi:TetR family transcriptional regulator C-terminal domain-containing protein [Kineosporia babensis]|uniref:TetR family transcriptional regulator C-terminal domain-containing protein n=1 Tax=Kineosporia babensis TaxID=499548 RepID=A0A9X1NL26_9ACTN|nr:TetR family transcriptional regulator C-terminal domain-containing protein [Kineosporia babensis]MCD5315063.1 TetR family transcriptional regulator C-terminal domain-containing protein [Kineosporia babensis]